MKSELNLVRLVRVTFGLIIAVVCTASFAADAEGLQACQSIEDDAARLACFDAALAPNSAPVVDAAPPEPVTSEQTAPEPAPPADTVARTAEAPPAAAPAPAVEPVAQTSVLSDDIGRETVSNVDRDKLAVRGKLNRCDRGRSGKYVFYFDSGQIWRQMSSGRVTWNECDFEVTIGKDVFGYTMVRDGEKRKVRIERVK